MTADLQAAIRDFLTALDRNYLTVNRPDSAFVQGLRDALAKSEAQ